MTDTSAMQRPATAFANSDRIASGPLERVVLDVKARIDAGSPKTILIFDDAGGTIVDIDFRGSPKDVLERLARRERRAAPDDSDRQAELARRGPGRPRLGVVGREVTLLPRHWEWLNRQPGGASAAIRRLVERARREGGPEERRRASQNAAFRFMTAMAGNEPGYEDAIRSLFSGDADGFDRHTRSWPVDVRDYARRLASVALAARAES